LIIDLALPRDVEPAAADIPGVKLLNLDDIGSIKAEGMDAEAEKARLIIDREVDNLWQELTGSAREKALLR
jgi:glutamyl-tRNA reductase